MKGERESGEDEENRKNSVECEKIGVRGNNRERGGNVYEGGRGISVGWIHINEKVNEGRRRDEYEGYKCLKDLELVGWQIV